MRRSAGVLTLWLLLFFSAFTLARPADARDQLVIGMTQFPTTLNPMIDSMLVKTYVLGMAQRQVTIFGHDWEPICLWCTELPTFENKRAKRFAVLDAAGKETGREGVRTTYTLKPDALWGDGTPITTDDVLFSWKVGRHPETGVADANSYQEILDIEIEDERTFTIVLDKIDYRYNALGDF
ncbi:MAG: ABC transporter substrate-binding protein, partial [Nisaea sp.]